MKKRSIFSVILCVALTISMVVPVFADNGNGNGAATTTVDPTTNAMIVNENSRMDTNGASYSYTLRSANDYVLEDGTVIFAYNDIQELAKDVVDIRNYLDTINGPSPINPAVIAQYDPKKIYNAYDYVIYDGKIWRCKSGKVGVTGPFEEALWDKIIDSDEDTYDPDLGYEQNEFAIYNSILWYAKERIPAPAGEFDSSKWSKILPIFDSTNYYLYVRKLQRYADKLQRLVDILESKTEVYNAKPYDPSATYNEGDMCLYKNKLYICIGRTSGDFDPSKWAVVDPDSGLNAKVGEDEAKIDSTINDITNLTNLFASTGIQVASKGDRSSTGDVVINAVFDIDPMDLQVTDGNGASGSASNP